MTLNAGTHLGPYEILAPLGAGGMLWATMGRPVSLGLCQVPARGEVFRAGSVCFIEWSVAVPGAEQPAVGIELSLLGPQGSSTSIATGLANNGRYQWHIPAGFPTSSNCYLRYTVGVAGTITPQHLTVRPGRGCAQTGRNPRSKSGRNAIGTIDRANG